MKKQVRSVIHAWQKMLGIKFLLLLVGMTIAGSSSLIAQGIKVSGVVKDATGSPIEGVSVTIKGTSTGTLTDEKGKYSINANDSKSILVFSSVGFTDLQETIGNRKTINPVMNAGSSNLEDVVVVGYGTQKKRDVTGAIASVSSAQITQRQPKDLLDALQGQVPGLQIGQSSGRPGADNSVRIRGIGTLQGGADPLYIVDGAQGVDISGINPNDIESVEVLKDAASAAIYGSRSANGVIIITTKKGKEGKPAVDLRYLTSASELSYKIPQANAADRRMYDLKLRRNLTQNDSLNPSYNADNDYQELLARTAVRQQVDLNVSGGNKGLNYYGGIGYLSDEGIIINSYARVLRGRFNMDFKPNSKFSAGNRLQISYQTENRIDDGLTLNQAIQRPPTFRVYFPDGTLAPIIGGRRNPVAEALYRKNNYEIISTNLYTYANYNFTKDLKLTVDANIRVNNTENLRFSPMIVSNTGIDNSGSINNDLKTYWMTQAFFNYSKKIGKDHSLTAVLGTSADNDFWRSSSMSGTNYVSETVLTFNSAQIITNATSSEQRSTSLSGFGRVGYSYKGKYLFNSNFRTDASSKFGKENRWGFFPSASVGWRFSDESFMQWAEKFLGEGKLRASYGQTGNDRIGAYDAIQRYTFGDNYYNGASGVAPFNIFGNSRLSWESTMQTNVGLDLSFLGNRLQFTMDYYNKITDKLLYRAPLPTETGYNNVNVNVGSIQNKGLEFSINANPVRKKNVQWNIIYNMSFNRATVKSLYNNITLRSSFWQTEAGGLLGNFYGWKALGVYPYDASNAYDESWQMLTPIIGANNVPTGAYTMGGKPYTGKINKLYTQGNLLKGGDMIWQNTIADSVIDDNDRIELGNAQPKFIAGLSNSVTYKGLTLSFNFYVSWGAKIYNKALADMNKVVTVNVTPHPDYIRGAWFNQGDVTKWYMAQNNGLGNSRELSSLYLEDASFIRLRNLRLSYSLPSKWMKKLKMKSINAFAYGNNLLTWTNYSWYDPEIDFNNPLEMGVDNGRYPRSREFGGGININL